MNEHIVGIDVGDVRIGIAVSDASRLIATPLEVLTRKGWGPDSRAIADICRRYDTALVVSGLPRNMDGSEGFQAQKVREFAAQLEKCGLTVYYQDERLTTVTADQALLSSGMRREKRKGHVDKVAAAVILQTWLDAQSAAAPERRSYTMSENQTPEYEDNGLLTLLDDDGNEVVFEHLATVEYEGEYYLCLGEVTEDEDREDQAVVLMRIDEDEDGNEIYTTLEDEELGEAVFQKFMEELDAAGEEDED